jgi:hypothetical protein
MAIVAKSSGLISNSNFQTVVFKQRAFVSMHGYVTSNTGLCTSLSTNEVLRAKRYSSI